MIHHRQTRLVLRATDSPREIGQDELAELDDGELAALQADEIRWRRAIQDERLRRAEEETERSITLPPPETGVVPPVSQMVIATAALSETAGE